jgi:hypothetical protein
MNRSADSLTVIWLLGTSLVGLLALTALHLSYSHGIFGLYLLLVTLVPAALISHIGCLLAIASVSSSQWVRMTGHTSVIVQMLAVGAIPWESTAYAANMIASAGTQAIFLFVVIAILSGIRASGRLERVSGITQWSVADHLWAMATCSSIVWAAMHQPTDAATMLGFTRAGDTLPVIPFALIGPLAWLVSARSAIAIAVAVVGVVGTAFVCRLLLTKHDVALYASSIGGVVAVFYVVGLMLWRRTTASNS